MIDFDTMISRENTASLKWDFYKGRDVLPFWVADMDFAVAEPIRKALEERLGHALYGYTVAPEGLAPAIIEHLDTHFDWQVDPEWIVWLPGVVTGLAIACRAFCPDGHEVVTNPPIYHHFFGSHDAARQHLVQVPLHQVDGRWTYDLEAMEAAFNDKTRVLLMSSPHNPTGTVFAEDELQAVTNLCARYNVIMVSDEIHCDLVIDKAVKHCPVAKASGAEEDRVVTLMSGSKTWNLAGLNCSFAIIKDKALRKKFKAASYAIVPGVPPLAYVATEAAYRHGEEWRQALLDYLAANYEFIKTELADVAGMDVQPIQATYLAWINVSGLPVDDVKGLFEKFGAGLSSGEQFGQAGYVRLNFACPREMLSEGLMRIKKAVASLD